MSKIRVVAIKFDNGTKEYWYAVPSIIEKVNKGEKLLVKVEGRDHIVTAVSCAFTVDASTFMTRYRLNSLKSIVGRVNQSDTQKIKKQAVIKFMNELLQAENDPVAIYLFNELTKRL